MQRKSVKISEKQSKGIQKSKNIFKMSGAAFDLITGRASAVPQVILAFTLAPQPLLQEIQMRWGKGKGKEFKRHVDLDYN